MSTRRVVCAEFGTPVCTVVAIPPETLPPGRAVLSGGVILEFGSLKVSLADTTAVEFARQLMNAATVAQGVALKVTA